MDQGLLSSDDVSRRLAGLVGQRAWGTALGVGSFLTLEFGDVRAARPAAGSRAEGRQHGAWHMWLYCCAWRIDGPASMIVASEDAREYIAAKVGAVDGATVVRADIQQGCTLRLEFDTGLVLTSFAIFSSGYEHWFVYLPDGTVITAGPGLAYSVERATAH
jgi:hypothetical protein